MDLIKKTAVIKNQPRAFEELFLALEKKLAMSRLKIKSALSYIIMALKAFPDGEKRFTSIIKAINTAIKQLSTEVSNTSTTNAENGSHAFVEMGDGLKWAVCNIGASKPEETGDFFAWGETKPYYTSLDPLTFKPGRKYHGYEYNTHFVFDETFRAIKYSSDDGKNVLEPVDDAAKANWGGAWRMPTSDEWLTLMDENKFTWTKTQLNGVDGFNVTSKISGFQGNSIFLPLTGHLVASLYFRAGYGSGFWASTHPMKGPLYSGTADMIILHKGDSPIMGTEGRYKGLPIRAVSE